MIYKKFFYYFFIIFNSFFLFNVNANLINENLEISNNCKDIYAINSLETIEKLLKKMNLELSSRKYLRSMLIKRTVPELEVGMNSGRSWSKYEKLIVKFANSSCFFEGTYRLTGDFGDHFGSKYKTHTEIPHSIKIKLKNDHIGNITKFKLFVPDSRKGERELFNVLVNQEMGFLAPKTFITNIQIKGLNYSAIFQEDITKEFLENNNYHESLLFEGSENIKIGMPIITNPDLINNKYADDFAEYSISQLSEIYWDTNKYGLISQYKDPPLLIDKFDKETIKEFIEFHLLNFGLDSAYGLSKDDHRILFDRITRKFHPIYYDGHYENNKLVKTNFIFSESERGELIKRLSQINRISFLELMHLHGSKIELNNLNNFFDELISKIQNLKLDENYQNDIKKIAKMSNKEYLKTLNDGSHKRFFEHKNFNYYFFENENEMQYGTMLEKKIIENNFSKLDRKFILSSNTIVEHTPNLNVEVNEFNREINIRRKIIDQNTSQVRIFGGSLEGWKIVSKHNAKLGYKMLSNSRYSEFGTTGCITFNDLNLKNVYIKITNSNCEDAINFVRANGTIKKIEIHGSLYDSIDSDFSQIVFDEVIINNSGNDCIDFSQGNYVIKKAILRNCNDKGISAGEKSLVKLEDLQVINSTYGLASKDSSIVELFNGSFLMSKICTSTYRKKQEYNEGSIKFLGKIICNNK